jgi:ribosomal protein S18 acetylase RimI-like enzyme
MEYRPINRQDRAALRAFAERIDQGDRSFFDRLLLHDVAIESWTVATPARRVAAFDHDEIVGLVTVVPGVGWTSHVGELRAVVRPDQRGRGIGRELVSEGIGLAREVPLKKITVEVMDTNAGALAMFSAEGFEPEARLVGQVLDGDGVQRDLLVLSRWLEHEPFEL